MSLNVKNYVYTVKVNSAPRINVSLNTITSEELATAKATYLNEVTTYCDNLEFVVSNKEYILDRFKKDALVDVGFATVDFINNTYTENTYATKYWNKAVSGLDLTRQNNLTTAITNLAELYQLFLNNSNEKFDNTTKSAVDYDIKAIDFAGTKFILTVPNATGTNRVYENNGDTISYIANKWTITKNNGDVVAICDDIDVAEPYWTFVNEESSGSSEEPVVGPEESSESSESSGSGVPVE